MVKAKRFRVSMGALRARMWKKVGHEGRVALTNEVGCQGVWGYVEEL